jgi:two-component system sensor histidine kinase AtoS
MVATYLAAVSTKSLLTYNFVALEQDTEKIAQGRDVLYAIILDRDGRVAVYSRHDEKQGLILQDSVSQRAAQAMHLLLQHVPPTPEEVEHYDIAVPVFIAGSPNKWGTVRVGVSLSEMRQEIVQTRRQVLLLGVLGVAGSLMVAAWLAHRIVAPLQALTKNTVAIAHGDLEQTITVQSHDEIAVLADNFNTMTGELRKHRLALEETNRQLDRKVLELSALAHYNDNILASMTSGLLTLDGAGRLATVNAMAETIIGVQGHVVRGQLASQVFANNAQFLQVLETSRQHHTPLATPRIDFLRPDGKHVPLTVRTAMLQGQDAWGGGLLAIFEDVSPLQTLERRLHRADRLAALGQMAAGVAHEIKNPLASVRTFAQLVSRKHHDSRFVEKFDRIVPQELSRINFIVEELLDLARPAHLRCAPVTLPTLLQQVVDLHSERLQQQNIDLKAEFAEASPVLLADAEQLQRGFGNIILNAIEAMPTGGILHLLCRPVSKVFSGFVTPRYSEQSPHESGNTPRPLDLYTAAVEVICTDTGSGIAAAEVEQVFTPFWTTKPKGTGLGLALTHKIIEEHGGTIYLTSEEGHGTVVTVRLPLTPPPTSASAHIS